MSFASAIFLNHATGQYMYYRARWLKIPRMVSDFFISGILLYKHFSNATLSTLFQIPERQGLLRGRSHIQSLPKGERGVEMQAEESEGAGSRKQAVRSIITRN